MACEACRCPEFRHHGSSSVCTDVSALGLCIQTGRAVFISTQSILYQQVFSVTFELCKFCFLSYHLSSVIKRFKAVAFTLDISQNTDE